MRREPARMEDDAPRLVTLDLDPAATAFFEALRQAHYPASRNRVPAHVMLFHRIASEHAVAMEDDLARMTQSVAGFSAIVTGLRSIGGGVAYDLDAPELIALRGRLAAAWRPWLVPQDLERYRPHVVVQNKVEVATAQATLDALRTTFTPFGADALGLRMWTYRNGFWHEPRPFPFENREPGNADGESGSGKR